MLEWMQIVFELTLDNYAPFRCLEEGSPEQPLDNHGPSISIFGNLGIVEPGFYILLDRQGMGISSRAWSVADASQAPP
jgi:hypothetical protein